MKIHPLHQLLERKTCSALLADFGQMFPDFSQLCLVDVEGRVVGQYPDQAREIDLEHLLSAIDLARQSEQLSVVPIGVAAPVRVMRQFIGALVVASPHILTPNEIAALRLFIHFLNTLIENSQTQKTLLQETHDRYRELNLLYHVGETIAASLDLTTVNRLLLDESVLLTQADEGAVILLDQESNQLTVWASRGLDAVNDIGPGIPLGYELAKKVVRDGQTQIVQGPELGRRKRPLNTLLCMPLRTKDDVLGVICLAFTRPEREFRSHDVKLLNALAGQAAVAIDNARMFSDLMKLHTELAEANRRLTELDQLKSSFLGVITHEMRTPFANIDFSLQLIERYGTDTWPPEQHEQWTQLIRLTREAKGMIDHLISFAGLLSKQGDLFRAEVDFPTLIKDVVATLVPAANSRQVELLVEPSQALAPIMGDEVRLAEAAYHLIHNAIKFNRPGGKVNIRYWQKDAKMVLEIEDTGYGIPAEKLELLWNLFSQVADPLKRGVEGLGLGLALVKYVVNAHEGEVDVVSKEDVGSTFRFWIPL